MSATKMKCGRCVAAYVQDGQGRRLVLAREHESGFLLESPLVLALTQGEARDAIRTLYNLLEELPP